MATGALSPAHPWNLLGIVACQSCAPAGIISMVRRSLSQGGGGEDGGRRRRSDYNFTVKKQTKQKMDNDMYNLIWFISLYL